MFRTYCALVLKRGVNCLRIKTVVTLLTIDCSDAVTNARHFIFTSGGTEKARLTGSGRLLLLTATDNGVDALQVNGSISATRPLSYSGITALSSVNLDDYKLGNVYYADATCSNLPTAAEYFIEVIAYGGSSWTIQRASNIRDARMYQRAFNASTSTWTSWSEK